MVAMMGTWSGTSKGCGTYWSRRRGFGRRIAGRPAGKKHMGRPRAIGPAELATLRRLVDDGVSVTKAARTLKIGRSTGYAAIAQPS